MIVSLVLALLLLLTTVPAAQIEPTVQLLTFDCVERSPGQSSVLLFEREVFPPFSDTGLFVAAGQAIGYVEQGFVTVFGDDIGKETTGAGFAFFASPQSSLGVRNEEFADASILWARIVPAAERSRAGAYMSPAALRSLRLTAPVGEPAVPPLFFEFDLPEPDAAEQVYLFIARIEFAAFAGIDQVEGSAALTNSGTVAIVVDSGELRVDDGSGFRDLSPGDGHAVAAGKPYAVTTARGLPAAAFLVGIVAPGDEGRIGTEIRNAAASDRRCADD